MSITGQFAGGISRALTTARQIGRDQAAVLAGLAAPLALTAILIPFRDSFPNTHAALALVLVVVTVAATGYRLAGVLASVSAAVWFDFFLTVPYYQFTITRRADVETAALILVIGIAVTEIAVRLLRDGRVISSVRVWDPGREGLPLGVDTELLAEAGGLLQGRFLLTPGPEARPTLEQRLVAVGLADQAGAALAGARLAGLR